MKFLSGKAIVALSAALMVSSALGQDATIDPTGTIAPTMFDNCEIEMYYTSLLQASSPSNWTQEALSALIKETHRNILPTHGKTGDDDDLYKAIIDLDPGNESGTVRLVYRDINAADYPNANPLYWGAERLWPQNRGYDSFSPAFTDVHHIKPAKSTVLMSKGNLSFGMCDTVEFQTECVVPATTETASDTAQDGKIWTPPERFRGEIARALFYMDLRYQQLNLQDCGPFVNSMGYKSQLLEWHDAYPPTEDELFRNDKACFRWQGNRNPFVDYPELAQSFFGTPEQIEPGTRTYPTCIKTFPPWLPPTREMIVTKDPDEVVFLPMFDIPGEMELFITDQAWNGTGLVTGVPNEGTMVMTTPEDGIEQGDLFGMGPGVDYGDTCGNWSMPGLSAEDYGEALTALPEQLDQGSIVLPHLDNYFYNGSRNETIALLRADMLNPASWVGDNEGRFGVEQQQSPLSGASMLSVQSAVSMTGVLITAFLV
ncbi:expressed unknown protein [Seminavis robusta]|uniref:Endonuclease I n=1 Tax=Seminavis robusta TaxID=568900 RepID=A0A9N8EAF3_9STRA|nr:expressed unknown protein [Seminavis robusta]|eukprot:Sro803_g204840.1 n/a (485) ;mRNA; r:45033-46740